MHFMARQALTVLLVAGSCLAQTNSLDGILGGLRDQPLNPVLLRELKGAIAAEPAPQKQCQLGVLYALGTLASGNAAEGLDIRARLQKAFPESDLLQDLADERIGVPCRACEAGRILEPCTRCNGTGKCPACKGTGEQTLPGLGAAPRKVKCMYCAEKPRQCRACGGSKGTTSSCPECGGTGRVVSAGKAQVLYRRMLLALAPPVKKEPPPMVVAGVPPAAVRADPAVIRQEWVERSLEAAKTQAAAEPLLQKYGITAEAIRAARDPALTDSQRAEAVKALRQKGLAHGTRGSYFFLPFPAGLRYGVAEVKRNPYGGYFLKLTSTLPVRNAPKAELTPREALQETARAICEPLGDFLSDPTICVSGSDAGAARLRKGEVVESGAWLVPVNVSLWGDIAREGTCYQTAADMMTHLGLSR
jgi:hypothetical protein